MNFWDELAREGEMGTQGRPGSREKESLGGASVGLGSPYGRPTVDWRDAAWRDASEDIHQRRLFGECP